MFKGKFYQLIFAVIFTALFSGVSVNSFAQDVISEDAAVIEEGKKLFDGNCKACHRVHENLVGPALADVYNRAPSIEWIKSFVKNSSKVIESGDEYANKIFNDYNKTMMTSFPFEDAQIMAVLAYIQDETIKGPPAPELTAAPADGTVVAQQGGIPTSTMNIVLAGLIIVLVLIFVVLLMIIGVMKQYVHQQSDLSEEELEELDGGITFTGVFQSKPFMFLATFFIVALIFKGVINGLYSVGIQKDYQPAQPIAFSHLVHAGTNAIDCNYCHTGVRKSKSANIPSANICMNCHTSILPESVEVKKIYAAIENNQPIEWVRVHNLPDLAYFNHSQHVEVGKQECQTCHGAVETMDVVKQDQLLTMGWCIDCHRTTNVASKGNDYYENLVNYHEGAEMTVEQIGGLECAKCHY